MLPTQINHFIKINLAFLLLVIWGADCNEFQCPEKFGHYPDTNDCQKYYVCDHGRTLVQKCDEGLLYNTYLKTCDWPRNVQCDRVDGRRVNTRRNPDLQKTAFFDDTNRLNGDHSESDDEDNEENRDQNDRNEQPDYNQKFMVNNRPASQPKPRAQALRSGDGVPQLNPKFSSITSSRRPATHKPRPTQPANASPLAAPPPAHEYEYDVPDYYDYEDYSKPVAKHPRKPVLKDETDNDYTTGGNDKSKSPSVKRMGWLPGDQDSHDMNEYHWSPKDGSEYSKDKPNIPNEAFIKMKDFRNTEKQFADDNSPNVGPEPKDLEDDDEDDRDHREPVYDDYYEDDSEEYTPEDEGDHHHDHKDDHHHHHDDEQPGAPETPGETNKAVTYDDDDEVRAQPKVQPPRARTAPTPPATNGHYMRTKPVARPPPVPPPPYIANSPQYARTRPATNLPPVPPTNQILGHRAAITNEQPAQAKKYLDNNNNNINNENNYLDNKNNDDKPAKIKTNIHFKNNKSPYLRSLTGVRVGDSQRIRINQNNNNNNINNNESNGNSNIDSNLNNNNNNNNNNEKSGTLVVSTPRTNGGIKKKIVIKKFVSNKNKQPGNKLQGVQSSESDSSNPSVYQVLDDYRHQEIPDTILKHKSRAHEFRDSIIDNYMNNDKPNYILNDNDFDIQITHNVKGMGEDGDRDGELVRNFDDDFDDQGTTDNNHDKQNSNSDRKAVIHMSTNNNNNLTQRDSKVSDRYPMLNSDSNVKLDTNNNVINSINQTPIKISRKPPTDNKWYKNQTFSRPPKVIINDYKVAPKRTPQTFFGWKQSVVFDPPVTTATITTTTKRPFIPLPPPPPVYTTTTTAKPRIRIKATAKLTHQTPVMKAAAKPADNMWYQNVKYEANPSNPTAAYTKASKCSQQNCKLPDCRCGGTHIPGGLQLKQTPQIIMLTFDDSVNDLNWEIYDELFNSGRKNPNGCPILATFYVSHEWTDYAQVQTLYSRGHEMASHSITHSFGEKFSKDLWLREVVGQREILNLYGGVKESDVRGMRAPFLQTGGNTMFEMLYEANMTYDSSLPVYDINPPYYPYTLDYAINHECMITPCPTKSFPGLWEVGMVMWEDLRNGRCSMADACFNPSNEQGVYDMVKKNFDRHYTTNRAPFGIYFHSRWFLTEHNRKGFIKWMDEINGLNDVYFVTNWQMIQWMRDPQPVNRLSQFKPWQCDRLDRPPECHQPNQCKARFRSEVRVMKTCQPCPKIYPWRDNNGQKTRT